MKSRLLVKGCKRLLGTITAFTISHSTRSPDRSLRDRLRPRPLGPQTHYRTFLLNIERQDEKQLVRFPSDVLDAEDEIDGGNLPSGRPGLHCEAAVIGENAGGLRDAVLCSMRASTSICVGRGARREERHV